MIVRVLTTAAALALLFACAPQPAPQPVTIPAGRPLDVLQWDTSVEEVRQDLLVTAAGRFGAAPVKDALAAPHYIIAKRFAGMLPPPPPGEESKPPPTPTALLMNTGSGWMVATASGWRRANPEAAAEIDSGLADAAFWSDETFTPPCPDYGAGLLLAKVPGKPEVVRKSLCSSRAETVVSAALRA
jgi:hypothetical protein